MTARDRELAAPGLVLLEFHVRRGSAGSALWWPEARLTRPLLTSQYPARNRKKISPNIERTKLCRGGTPIDYQGCDAGAEYHNSFTSNVSRQSAGSIFAFAKHWCWWEPSGFENVMRVGRLFRTAKDSTKRKTRAPDKPAQAGLAPYKR
jgi:hypothetical protein